MDNLEPARPTRTTSKSASEKVDATTRIAREIILQETAARDAKTARLKALRLAKEAETAAAIVVDAAPKKARAPRVKKASAKN